MSQTAASNDSLGTSPGPHVRRPGDRVPDVRLRALQGTEWTEISTGELCAGRNVIVFSLPGAFTPTCSTQHLPRYEELAPTFEKLGIDDIVCVSVNDPYVMEEWARNQGASRVRLLPDGNGAFTRAMGLLVDMSEDNFGPRSWRYSMLVRDGIIEKMFVEPAEGDDPYGVSDADTMLAYLDPKAARPDEIAMISRPGCPFCAKAKAALETAGLSYVDISLPPLERAKALRALTGSQTVPQVFVNGKLIGDSEAVLKWLAQRPATAGAKA